MSKHTDCKRRPIESISDSHTRNISMGSLNKKDSMMDNNEDTDSSQEEDENEEQEIRGEDWPFENGQQYWQSSSRSVRDRIGSLFDCRQMSDVCILACDEQWWFGDTVKDFNAHKLVLGSSSPVLYHILYELDEQTNPERRVILDKSLGVTLTLSHCFDYDKVEVDGIPPIAMAAALEYMYKDKFNESDFENGYSRNLLWRLWHAGKALEINHLTDLCSKAIKNTMCHDTVFWDLNYAMQYSKALGTNEVMSRVLEMCDGMQNELFENPNFVWLEKEAVEELLGRRKANGCDALVIFNNLLRWAMYQVDRTACTEIEGKTGSEIPVIHRLRWIKSCRAGEQENVKPKELNKYLKRAFARMPWHEMSQKDFLEYVVPFDVLGPDDLLKEMQASITVMEIVVQNPERLLHSAYETEQMMMHSEIQDQGSPSIHRKRLSRTNSLQKSITEVKLRRAGRENSRDSQRSRPNSMVMGQ